MSRREQAIENIIARAYTEIHRNRALKICNSHAIDLKLNLLREALYSSCVPGRDEKIVGEMRKNK